MSDISALLPDLKLRFNIQHPSFEECYAFGYECANAEIEEEENPYHHSSKESEQWLEGWWDGFYGKEPLFVLKNDESSLLPEDAANDLIYTDHFSDFWVKVIEITGILAVSVVVGYQVIDLVA